MAADVLFIVARATNGVIAKDGDVPWKIREDLQHFVRQTMGKPMVMGRKTFESLPGLLPKRRHIVLTRNREWSADGAEVAHTVEDALALCGRESDIAVIGGADIFEMAKLGPAEARSFIGNLRDLCEAVRADEPGDVEELLVDLRVGDEDARREQQDRAGVAEPEHLGAVLGDHLHPAALDLDAAGHGVTR